MTPGHTRASRRDPLAFVAGGGEMGERIRAFDWSTTPLGPIKSWPQSLRTTVNICLASDLPICIIWGPGLVQIYNDGYRVICGDKHPRSLGQNFPECWREAWPVIGEAHDSALSGDTAFLETQRIFLDRHGYTEECFFTFSFSPIRDEAGGVGGLFHPVIEMTANMLGERRTHSLRDVAARTAKAKTVQEACVLAARALADHDQDVPFALLYLLDAGGQTARLVASAGTAPGQERVEIASAAPPSWPLAEVVGTGQTHVVDDVEERFGPRACGPYPEAPRVALALPLTLPGSARPVGVLITGVSGRLKLTRAYRDFHELLAAAVSTAVANGRAFEEERRRAEALAELDRAKTAFFSNVSHEFRTPLTLMLGPLEELLARGDTELTAAAKGQLEVVNRNGLRLLRLVNTLLDFSRIEAGRVRAVYQPTDLAAFTADLASVFRSACERAGLRLTVDCPPLREPVFVDRDMWEKVVFNLLSNAFKFTFDGEIAVTLAQAGDNVELRVRDTGTGIPAAEMPRLFERFHRVEHARGRTHEGSGIGMALVQELVRLHGGSIAAASEEGRGTTFTATLPLGSAHLPPDQIAEVRSAPKPGSGASPYIEEALRWLPDDARSEGVNRPELPTHYEPLPTPYVRPEQAGDERPRVLVADDNADMRQYVARLLAEHYRVRVVPDGEAALAAVRDWAPDLILTDVMMPRLDGFGLLRALRANPRTSAVPVIMLSARAGEESRVEGMQGGADDYLIKPFGAKELLARVGAHLQMARMRREAGESIRASEERFRALVSATSDVVYRMSADWTEMRHLRGREFIADTHEPSRSWLVKYIPPEDRPHVLEAIRAAVRSKGTFELEHRVVRVDGTVGWTFSRAIPLLDGNGEIMEWFGAASDVTTRKQVEEALRAEEGRTRTILASITDGFFALDADWRFTYMNAAGERFIDCTPGYLIGKCFWDEYPGTIGSEFERFYRRVAATRVSESLTAHYPDRDRWYEATAYPAPNGLSVYFRDVTDRRQVEQERGQFAALVDASPDFIGVAGLDQRGLYLNRAGEELIGLEPGQVGSTCVLDYFPESERDRIRGLIADSEGGAHVVVDAHFRHFRTGQLIPVSWSFLRLRDASGNVSGYATVTRDLTERKKAEEQLLASEERRRLALDAAELGMWNFDPASGIVQTDARYRTIFGTTEECPDSLQLFAIIHPDDVAAVQESLAAAIRLEDPVPSAIEYRVVHPDGSLRWVSGKGQSSIEGTGATRRVVSFDGAVADITDRKRGEEERERLVARLRDQDRRKDEFLATLAHELRNPLAPIRNGLQIMKLAKNDAASAEKVRAMMERQLEQMVRLIDDLLDLSRISRGKVELKTERVELTKVVLQAVENSRPLIDQASHDFAVNVPPDPICVDADATRLAQVFTNLLNNAAKYTDRGGRIRLTVEREGGDAVVTVRDNGMGIPANMLPKVFDIFTQVDRSLEKSQGGLGIGLSLVKGLVELHGGTVEARSDGRGAGSEFVVRMPVALALVGDIRDEGGNGPDQPNARRRILVVDDNCDGADSLALMLRLLGNELQTAYDGLEALEVAAAFRPDLVMLDIGMPKLNGYDTARRLREQPWAKSIVLVALTGWGQDEDRRKSREAGFDSHMVKPVDAAALEKLLAGLRAETA